MGKEKSTAVESIIKLNTYSLIERAVEEGTNYGWNRAHKHTANPEEQHIKNEIVRAVMNSLDEIIIWPDI